MPLVGPAQPRSEWATRDMDPVEAAWAHEQDTQVQRRGPSGPGPGRATDPRVGSSPTPRREPETCPPVTDTGSRGARRAHRPGPPDRCAAGGRAGDPHPVDGVNGVVGIAVSSSAVAVSTCRRRRCVLWRAAARRASFSRRCVPVAVECDDPCRWSPMTVQRTTRPHVTGDRSSSCPRSVGPRRAEHNSLRISHPVPSGRPAQPGACAVG